MNRRAAAFALVALVAPSAALADDKDDDRGKGDIVVKPLPPYEPGKPDRWAVLGGEEANLEGTGIRSGFAFVGYLGPALQIGVEVPEHATGTGGAFSFRLGRFANRDTLITLEICGTVFPYRYETGVDPAPVERHTVYNQSALAAFGAQTYVAPTFWLRAAVGVAGFTSRAEGAMFDRSKTKWGGGAVAGAGVEIVRRKSLSLAVELLATGAVYRNGLILGGGLGLSLGIY